MAVASGPPRSHTCSVGLPALGSLAHILEAVSTLLQHVPPSICSSLAAWTASQPVDASYGMACGTTGCLAGLGDSMLTDSGPPAAEDLYGSQEFLGSQPCMDLLGEALVRDSTLQGNAAPQLTPSELVLLQEAHAASASAQTVAAA